ncbi:MAG: glucose-6-phosphate isomerase [Thermotogota bacterium]
MKGIKFDFSNLFESNVKTGIKESEINDNKVKIKKIINEVLEENPGFLDVPYTRKWVDSVLDLKSWVQSFDAVVVLGIGGSALGNLALQTALNPLNYNSMSKDKRKTPKVFVIDNVDPDYIASVLDSIDVSKTLFNVISKSGTTAEAMSNYMIARGIIESYGLNGKNHLLFTTDPENGVLRKIADEENIRTLEIPQSVGGRFTVLTPVGLLSAVAGGIDVIDLINGAKDMCEKVKNDDVWENPAALNALIHHIYYNRGYNISVMMPYSNRLFLLADWYRQLWAESLGKRTDVEGKEVFVGQTPVKALGATDQHSQVQLYNEGPHDKIVTFLKLEKFDREITIPNIHEDIPALKYLGGKKVSDLLNTELTGTEYALVEHNRPNMKIIFPEINPYNIGQFLFAYEFQTAIMGKLLNINAYDQPGVELGKQVTYGLMGREGHEGTAKEVKEKIQGKKDIRL